MYTSSKKVYDKNPKLVKRIDECVKRFVDIFSPEKIILFGSFARGEVDEDGTLDFLIIAKTRDKFFDRIKKALVGCRGDFPSIEPLIYTPQEFNLLWSQGEGFLEDAVEEGIVLYQKEK